MAEKGLGQDEKFTGAGHIVLICKHDYYVIPMCTR